VRRRIRRSRKPVRVHPSSFSAANSNIVVQHEIAVTEFEKDTKQC
jgi:hypothetical protein